MTDTTAPVPPAPRSQIITPDALGHLQAWLSDQDPARLFAALAEWHIGFAAPPTPIRLPGGGLGGRLTLRKPRGEGLTTRDVDLPFLGAVAVLCIPAGRAYLEPHGMVGGYYYLRLSIPGRRGSGQKRRTYLLRVAADTPSDLKTREPRQFRSLLRQDLGAFRQDPATGEMRPATHYSAADARADCLARVAELAERSPSKLPPGLTVAAVSEMLERAFSLLGAVPLGLDTTSAA